MMRRVRLLSVLVILLCGGVGVMSSTQTWLTVTLTGGAAKGLAVSGAAAVPVLAPLSLATLALGGALSIAGRVVRHIAGALAVVIGAVQGFLAAQVLVQAPTSSFAQTVTGATGITGNDSIAALVDTVTRTPWPAVTVAVWVVLVAAGVLILVTAHRWGESGHKYGAAAASRVSADGPLDAVDSWDGLSRGEDPTDADGRR